VAQISINNYNEYEKYLAGYDEIFKKYQGEVIAVDDNPTLLEGKWNYTRIVLIRFPDEAELRLWYESEEYQKLAKHRWNSSEADILILNGRM